MSHHAFASPAPLRVAAVWLASATATAAVALLGGPSVVTVAHAHAAVPFDQLLVAGCGAVATAGCLVLLGSTTSVALALCTGRLPGRVGPLRSAVLAACGAAVLVSVPVAAHATATGHRHDSAIAGLPLPDRASGNATGRSPDHDIVHVRPGDSLWAIARSRLGAGATDAEVAAYCSRLYDHNAAAVGSDPDLILPGLRLALPPTRPLDR